MLLPLFGFVASTLVVPPAQAASPVTVSVAGGYVVTGATDPLRGGATGVGRVGLFVDPHVELVGAFGTLESRTTDDRLPYRALSPRLGVLYHLRVTEPVEVFLGLDLGARLVGVTGDGADDRAASVSPYADALATAGPGILVRLAGPLHLRSDLRWLGALGTHGTPSSPDAWSNLEWTVGFDLRAAKRADRDRDGVPDVADACLREPEDADGHQDADGCPDPDNDHDGVLDGTDQCPEGTEDLDGHEDADGCPDSDDDGDGIPDIADRCPTVAEDLDSFSDDDGCPDVDNDQDGIPDVLDACPNDPETVNGLDDGDGCPDAGR